MHDTKRFIASISVALSCLLVAGCSPDDAKAAKVAAAALKQQVDAAINAFSALVVRAKARPAKTPGEIIARRVNSDRAEYETNAAWQADAPTIERELVRGSDADVIRQGMTVETVRLVQSMQNIADAAADYEAAWPLGSREFVCLKSGIFALTKNLREVAASFDPGRASYQTLIVERAPFVPGYVKAVQGKDAVAATTMLHGYRDVLFAEMKANADVQAAFVRAAQSSADMYAAIESVESVSVADVLRLIERYAPGLSKLDDSIDGDAIAKEAGVVLGKVDDSKWLKRFADMPVPNAGPTCKL
jgi:hypothetical protein